MEQVLPDRTAVLASAHRSAGARFLDGFARFQQFVEDFISLGNGWLLLVSTGVALFSLMLDIRHAAGLALVLWALSQVFGVDLQFFVAMIRARAAYGQERWGALALWVLLALILAVAMWQALYAFGVENATGATEAQVFGSWGMSLQVWLGWRAFLVILLMMVAAITRHSRTVTEAHLLAGAPQPPSPPYGGLPLAGPLAGSAAAGSAEPTPFAPAQVQARPRTRKASTTTTTTDPRTARPAALQAQLRAQREQFAQLYFQQNPEAGAADLARALGISKGAVSHRLWEKYGKPAALDPAA